MTPKEKAKELVSNHYVFCNNSPVRDIYAKESALITTKETIESLEVLENTIDKIDNVNLSIFSAISYQIEYWKDVEQKINEL